MNAKAVRLLIVTGLPGAGKTHLIENDLRQVVTGLCVDDYHDNAIDNSPDVDKSRHFIALVEALKAGHDCVIADIEFCRQERRAKVAQAIGNFIPSIKIEYHCLKNQLTRCLKNIERRNRKTAAEEKAKATVLSKSYHVPAGATEYEVWNAESSIQ